MQNQKNEKDQAKKFQIPVSRFVEFLERLEKDQNRGALAALRRGLQYELGRCIEMYPYVMPWLGDVKSKWENDMHYLIAALFAYHPSSAPTGNLGEVFYTIKIRRHNEKSIEQRFLALLRCNPEDLPFHLRQVISIARSENIPINWHELFYDLKRWPYSSKYPPQEKWARSFWKKEPEQNNQE
ncbi:MAG: type I-E CRISPR-associated protein Cse2/CasB [Candidatus Helarchaeota archaeon]